MAAKFKLTKNLASKVLKTVDAGLSSGLGRPEPGHMCVEAAVCYAMGLPHSDNPTCVSLALRRLKIILNDAAWSSKAARAQGLRRLAIAQLGSADRLDDYDFARQVALYACKFTVSSALENVALIHPDTKHQKALRDAAEVCREVKDLSAARSAADAADAARSAADAADAADAARSAAASDKSLSDFAEGVVQILIAMKAPGCKYLNLTEIAA